MFLECKQCGGQVPVQEGKGVAACPYCGSANTVGKSAISQGGLVNRANYLRRNNEFDKAAGVYEELLKSDNMDYEAHWGLVLCKFGIEYVDDPKSGERKPTCHRTYPDSVFADSAYRAALEYAPLDVREVYEKEAAQIDRIQKDIIALSQREEKFDVFLCYKELDESGNRTQDSVIAQELEFELARRGYKVFFARKTLEKVLGSAYEPVIYAALQSARAMVVLGTKPEHFQAVWVRNEWSRYRELIKKGADKVLIPAYRGMSPYDLPMELSNLQSLDMGKLGFVQDLCDGIDRFVRASRRTAEPVAAAPSGGVGIDSLLKRAFLFIQEGSLDKASEYIERVLDQNPEEPRAYVARYLMDCGVQRESDLANLTTPVKRTQNLVNAEVFGGEAYRERLEGYLAAAEEKTRREEQARREEQEKREKTQNLIHLSFDDLLGKTWGGGLRAFFGTLFGVISLVAAVIVANNVSSSDLWIPAMIALEGGGPFIAMAIVGYVRAREHSCLKKCRELAWQEISIPQLAKKTAEEENYLRGRLAKWMRRGLFQYAFLEDDRLFFRFEEKAGSPDGVHVQSEAEKAVMNACVKRLPRGTLLFVLGGLSAVGMFLWGFPSLSFYLNKFYHNWYVVSVLETQGMVLLILLVLLAPAIACFAAANSLLKRRKLVEMLSPRIRSGETIAGLARQTGYTAKKLSKLLESLIDKRYMRDALIKNGEIIFLSDSSSEGTQSPDAAE